VEALPKFDEYLGSALDALIDEDKTARQVTDAVADALDIPTALRLETIPSGQRRLQNRVNWALSYLSQAKCVERPSRGTYRLTDRGRQFRRENEARITLTDLRQFPEFVEFQSRSGARSSEGSKVGDQQSELTPQEQLAHAVQEVESTVAEELIARLREMPPEFLEKAVLKLLVAMGYGGSESDVQHIGGSGDGGFDGVINQDRLGLERIFVQAKRYAADNAVSRPAVQGFVGALQGIGAGGGVFITTSRFTPDAKSYGEGVKPRVILIDGARLGSLMIQYGVGVQAKETYVMVEVDEDFFEE